MQELAKEVMSQRLLTVFDIVNTSIDHVPPAMYEFEVQFGDSCSEITVALVADVR